MGEEQSFTTEQSLELISNMISKAKDNFRENSFLFLLWGWLLSAASLTRFLLDITAEAEYSYAPFPIMAAVGIVITLMYYSKKSQGAETHLNYFLRKLWTILIIGFVLTVFISVHQNTDPTVYILIIEGIGTAVSGMVTKFTPLKLGGCIFFTAAVLALFVPGEYKTLVHGAAIIAGFIIPGYLLKNLNE